MSELGDAALDQLFREARTHSAWLDKPVSDEILERLYDVAKWGPTSANGSPARFVFIRSPEAKERLRPTLAPARPGALYPVQRNFARAARQRLRPPAEARPTVPTGWPLISMRPARALTRATASGIATRKMR